jgi:hypothetical protein
MVLGDTFTIQEMIDKIKQFSSEDDSRFDRIEQLYHVKKSLPASEIIYLKNKLGSLTSGTKKYKEKIKDESKKIISNAEELTRQKIDETLHKKCIKCGVNLLKKQIVTHSNSQSRGSTFMLSKSERDSLKKNIRANLERFLQRNFSEKICDSCFHEIIFDTKIYDVKCLKLSGNPQDVDGYVFLQNFDEKNIVFGDKKGRDFKIIPVEMIQNYQILFREELSNYRKIKDDLSFIFFNRSEKEKQERNLSSNLDSIDIKFSEYLSIEFTDGSMKNEIVLKSKNINELYTDVETICKNNN